MADPVEEGREQELYRRRKDRAPELMGQYLLRGYRMLASHCSQCTTVLLQSRDGEELCVYCNDILTEETAHDQREEGKAEQRHPSQPSRESVPTAPQSSAEDWAPLVQPRAGDWEESLRYTEEVLLRKLVETSRDLLQHHSTERSMHLCQLLSALANALSSIHRLREAKPTLAPPRM